MIVDWLRSAEKVSEKGNQGGADEGNTAACHQLLHALRLGTGVIVAVAFEQVNGTPDTETGTEGDDKRLENADCAGEKRHISSSSPTFRTADGICKMVLALCPNSRNRLLSDLLSVKISRKSLRTKAHTG